jgi:preprotein translocase subunit YajC
MPFAAWLIAQQPAAPADVPTWYYPLLWVPIFLVAYLLLFRPMQKQEQQRKLLLAALKKNDRVVTQGGIIGVVSVIKEKEEVVVLKVDDSTNCKISVIRGSIVRILEDTDKAEKEGGA